MASEKDPFTKVYDALVDAIQQRKLNVVDWNGLKNPRLDVPSTSDYPEVDLRPSAGGFTVGGSSCASDYTQQYTITVNTNDNRLGQYLLPIEWVLAKLVYSLQYGDALLGLKHNNRSFVINVTATSHVKGIVDTSGSRPQIAGWSSQWVISVDMSFSKEDLQ